MGTITIKVPQDIEVEYQVENLEIIENFIGKMNKLETPEIKRNELLGLFETESDVITQITDSLMKDRENSSLRV